MSLPRHLLGAGETVVFHLRTHFKRILWPLALGVFLLAIAIIGSVMLVPLVPASAEAGVLIAIWAVTAVLLVPVTLLPWWRWGTTTFTVTNRRIITRKGILHRTGSDIPLLSISNVSYERSLTDRMFGCGTLILQTSAEVPVTLDDIPDVERVHVEIADLLFQMGRGGARPAEPPAQ